MRDMKRTATAIVLSALVTLGVSAGTADATGKKRDVPVGSTTPYKW